MGKDRYGSESRCIFDDEALMTRFPVGKSALTSLISMRKTSPFFITSDPLHQMFQKNSGKGERD